MKLILNQIRKDVRVLRWVFAGWLAVAVVFHLIFLYASGMAQPDTLTINRLVGWWTVLFVLGVGGLLVLAALIVQEDSPTSTTAFWLTRPMSGKTMLASKSALVFVSLLLFPVALQAFDYIATGTSLRLFPLISITFQLTWLLPVLAIASATTGLTQFFLVAVYEILGFMGLCALAGATGVSVPSPNMLVALATVSVLSIAVFAYAYVARRPTVSKAVVALGPVLIFASLSVWPEYVQSSPGYSGPKYDGPVSITIDRSAVTVRQTSENPGFSSAGPPDSVVINVPFTVSGLPEGTELLPIYNAEAVIEAPGVKIGIPAGSLQRWRQNVADMRERASGLLRPVLGSVRVMSPERVILGSRGIHVRVAKALFDARIGSKPFSLRVPQTFIAYQYRTVAVVPPSPGAAYTAGISREHVTSNTAGLRVATVGVRSVSADLPTQVRAYLAGRYPDVIVYALRNRRAGEASVTLPRTVTQSFGSNFSPMFLLPMHCDMSVKWTALEFDLRGSNAPFSSRAWLDDSELVVMAERDIGRLTRTLELNDLTLSAEPSR